MKFKCRHEFPRLVTKLTVMENTSYKAIAIVQWLQCNNCSAITTVQYYYLPVPAIEFGLSFLQY